MAADRNNNFSRNNSATSFNSAGPRNMRRNPSTNSGTSFRTTPTASHIRFNTTPTQLGQMPRNESTASAMSQGTRVGVCPPISPQIAAQIPMLTSRLLLGFSPDANRVHQTSYNPAKVQQVELPATPPRFIRKLSPVININANINKNQSIQVTAIGYPEPSIAWYKDGIKLCEGVTITSSKIFTLGNGTYTCMIKNAHGEDATTAVISYVIINPPINQQQNVAGPVPPAVEGAARPPGTRNSSRSSISRPSSRGQGMSVSTNQTIQSTQVQRTFPTHGATASTASMASSQRTISTVTKGPPSRLAANPNPPVITVTPTGVRTPPTNSAAALATTNVVQSRRQSSVANTSVTGSLVTQSRTSFSTNNKMRPNGRSTESPTKHVASREGGSASGIAPLEENVQSVRADMFKTRVIPAVVLPKQQPQTPGFVTASAEGNDRSAQDYWSSTLNKRLETDEISTISSARDGADWRSISMDSKRPRRERRNSTGSVCSDSTAFYTVTEGSTVVGSGSECSDSTVRDEEFASPMSSIASFHTARSVSSGTSNYATPLSSRNPSQTPLVTSQDDINTGVWGSAMGAVSNAFGAMTTSIINTVGYGSGESATPNTGSSPRIPTIKEEAEPVSAEVRSGDHGQPKPKISTIGRTIKSGNSEVTVTETHIQHQPFKPTIKKFSDTVSTTVGSDVSLNVIVGGWPVPVAHWWFKSDNTRSQPTSKTGSGAFKVNSGRRHIVERAFDGPAKNSSKFVLTIKDVTFNDSGLYFITTESSLGKGIMQIRLEVRQPEQEMLEYPSELPLSVQDATKQYGTNNSRSASQTSVRTASRSRSNSSASRSTTVSNQMFSKMGQIQSHDLPINQRVLSRVREDDSISASTSRLSSISTISTQTKVSGVTTLQDTESDRSDSGTDGFNRKDDTEVRRTGSQENLRYIDLTPNNLPYFLVPLTDVKVRNGQTAKLVCEIPTSPELKFRWFLNGKRMVPETDRRYFVEHQGNVHRLIIPRADKERDNGVILLEARNKEGQINCKCRLTVEPNEVEPPSDSEYEPEPVEEKEEPSFTKPPPKTTYIKEGDRMRINVKVAGKPEPEVQWFHNNTNLTDNQSKTSNVRILRNAITGERIFEVSKIRMEQKGYYVCKIRNIHGHTEAGSNVMIRPKTPEIIEPPKSKKGSLFKKHFKTEHEISRGTTSVIKVGTHRQHGTLSEEERLKNQVVFKHISLHQRELKRWALNERNALMELNHMNIVLLVDNFKVYPEKHVLVLESLDLELLDHIILKNRVSEAQVANLIGQTLTGLQYIHSKDWAHLDLQPSNIMVRGCAHEEPIVKLIDFAFAKKISEDKPIFSKYGNPEFVAPEQVSGGPVTGKTDIWSVGVIMYLILSGVSPFQGETDKETLQKIQRCDWRFDLRTFRDIGKDAKSLISQLLQEHGADRIDATKAVLHEWFNAAPTRPAVRIERLRYFQSRRRWTSKISALGKQMKARPLQDVVAGVDGSGSYLLPTQDKYKLDLSDSDTTVDDRHWNSDDDMNASDETILSSEDEENENDIVEDSPNGIPVIANEVSNLKQLKPMDSTASSNHSSAPLVESFIYQNGQQSDQYGHAQPQGFQTNLLTPGAPFNQAPTRAHSTGPYAFPTQSHPSISQVRQTQPHVAARPNSAIITAGSHVQMPHHQVRAVGQVARNSIIGPGIARSPSGTSSITNGVVNQRQQTPSRVPPQNQTQSSSFVFNMNANDARGRPTHSPAGSVSSYSGFNTQGFTNQGARQPSVSSYTSQTSNSTNPINPARRPPSATTGPPISNITRYGSKHQMFEKRSSSLDRPYSNTPQDNPSGNIPRRTSSQISLTNQQHNQIQLSQDSRGGRAPRKQVSFEGPDCDMQSSQGSSAGSVTRPKQVNFNQQISTNEEQLRRSGHSLTKSSSTSKLATFLNKAKQKITLKSSRRNSQSGGHAGFIHDVPVVQITSNASNDGSFASYGNGNQPKSILKKQNAQSMTNLMSNRDIRPTSLSAGNYQQGGRNGSAQSTSSCSNISASQYRNQQYAHTNGVNSSSSYAAQSSSQSRMVTVQGQSVPSRQAGRISFNAGSHRTGVVRYSSTGGSSSSINAVR